MIREIPQSILYLQHAVVSKEIVLFIKLTKNEIYIERWVNLLMKTENWKMSK